MNFQNNKEILLTVIVPVYNVEKYITKCINSILIQTYSEFELLLIDDGSPDNSGYICDQYAISDKRVKVFHQKNSGVSSARNKGLENAKGRYIQFIDSDDYIENNMFELMLNKALQDDDDIVICDFYNQWKFVKKATNELLDINSSFTSDLIISNITPSFWNKLIKRKLFVENKINFHEGLTLGEDYLLMIKLSLFSNRVSKLDIPLYHYVKTNSSSSTNSFSMKHVDDTVKAFELMIAFFSELKINNIQIEQTILIGKLRKKLALILNTKGDVQMASFKIFPEINQIDFKEYIHKPFCNILDYIRRKNYMKAKSYIKLYNFVFNVTQIIKLRKFR